MEQRLQMVCNEILLVPQLQWCLGCAIMGARAKRQISEAELSRWRLIEQFEERLERAAAAGKEPHTFSDPRRKLGKKIT